MDEILIGEKRYVSSKQAAKVTGYAKDYIGQLCREGRVPARLVGRSWYVLESAIHDHRFGKQGIEPENNKVYLGIPKKSSISSTWESPRYEVLQTQEISSINRLENEIQAQDSPDDLSRNLQDSWKAWFDRVVEAGPTTTETLVVQNSDRETKELENKEVKVPFRTVQKMPPEDLLPRHRNIQENKGILPHIRGETQRIGGSTMIKIAGTILAVCAIILATIGSGYFDDYEVISSTQASVISGMTIYIK